jgi:hypothetical protein
MRATKRVRPGDALLLRLRRACCGSVAQATITCQRSLPALAWQRAGPPAPPAAWHAFILISSLL